MKKILLIAFCLTLMTGCGREIDDMAYVVAIGVDRADDGYEFTFAIGNPGSINGGGGEDAGGGDSNVLILEKEGGENILSAGDAVSARIGQEVNFSHAELLVFSSEVAADGTERFFDSLTRNLSQRPKLVPAVSEGFASEVLSKINSEFEGNPDVGINSREFLCRTENADAGSVMPLITVTDSGIEVGSLCVFKGDKLVSSIDDMLAYKMMRARIRDVYYDVGDRGTLILNRREKPKIEVNCDGDLNINVYVGLEGALAASSGDDKNALMNMAQEQIRSRLYSLFEYSSKVLGVDIFEFDSWGRKCFPDWGSWEEYNWSEKYKTATFNVTVEIKSEKTGLLKGEN